MGQVILPPAKDTGGFKKDEYKRLFSTVKSPAGIRAILIKAGIIGEHNLTPAEKQLLTLIEESPPVLVGKRLPDHPHPDLVFFLDEPDGDNPRGVYIREKGADQPLDGSWTATVVFREDATGAMVLKSRLDLPVEVTGLSVDAAGEEMTLRATASGAGPGDLTFEMNAIYPSGAPIGDGYSFRPTLYQQGGPVGGEYTFRGTIQPGIQAGQSYRLELTTGSNDVDYWTPTTARWRALINTGPKGDKGDPGLPGEDGADAPGAGDWLGRTAANKVLVASSVEGAEDVTLLHHEFERTTVRKKTNDEPVAVATGATGGFGAWATVESLTIQAGEAGLIEIMAVLSGKVREAAVDGGDRIESMIKLERVRGAAATALITESYYGPRNLHVGSDAYEHATKSFFEELTYVDEGAQVGDVYRVQVRHAAQKQNLVRTIDYATGSNFMELLRFGAQTTTKLLDAVSTDFPSGSDAGEFVLTTADVPADGYLELEAGNRAGPRVRAARLRGVDAAVAGDDPSATNSVAFGGAVHETIHSDAFATEAEAEADPATSERGAMSPKRTQQFLDARLADAAAVTAGTEGKLVDAKALRGVRDEIPPSDQLVPDTTASDSGKVLTVTESGTPAFKTPAATSGPAGVNEAAVQAAIAAAVRKFALSGQALSSSDQDLARAHIDAAKEGELPFIDTALGSFDWNTGARAFLGEDTGIDNPPEDAKYLLVRTSAQATSYVRIDLDRLRGLTPYPGGLTVMRDGENAIRAVDPGTLDGVNDDTTFFIALGANGHIFGYGDQAASSGTFVFHARRYIQADWDQTDPDHPEFIKNKPTLDEVQSDWDETDPTDPAFIQNKPTIEDAQADWDEADSTDPSFIQNKPTIVAPVQSDWNEADSTDPSYIKNKPTSDIPSGAALPANPTIGDEFRLTAPLAGQADVALAKATEDGSSFFIPLPLTDPEGTTHDLDILSWRKAGSAGGGARRINVDIDTQVVHGKTPTKIIIDGTSYTLTRQTDGSDISPVTENPFTLGRTHSIQVEYNDGSKWIPDQDFDAGELLIYVGHHVWRPEGGLSQKYVAWLADAQIEQQVYVDARIGHALTETQKAAARDRVGAAAANSPRLLPAPAGAADAGKIAEVNAAGDAWQLVAKGAVDDGQSPILGVVEDGERRVLRIVDWDPLTGAQEQETSADSARVTLPTDGPFTAWIDVDDAMRSTVSAAGRLNVALAGTAKFRRSTTTDGAASMSVQARVDVAGVMTNMTPLAATGAFTAAGAELEVALAFTATNLAVPNGTLAKVQVRADRSGQTGQDVTDVLVASGAKINWTVPGAPPVGAYLGASGKVDTAAAATDIRGPAGASG